MDFTMIYRIGCSPSMQKVDLWKIGVDSGQPARTAQADLNGYVLKMYLTSFHTVWRF